MSVSIAERILSSGSSQHTALVISPARPMVLGEARLAALRLEPGLSDVDRRIIREVAVRRGKVHVAIFRGVDLLGQRGWSFDERLDGAQARELGYVLTKALLPVHRRMMAHGIALLVHSEWGDRECRALRHGVRTVADELAAKGEPTPVQRADQWILRNMLFHFSLPLEHVLETVLPGAPSYDRRPPAPTQRAREPLAARRDRLRRLARPKASASDGLHDLQSSRLTPGATGVRGIRAEVYRRQVPEKTQRNPFGYELDRVTTWPIDLSVGRRIERREIDADGRWRVLCRSRAAARQNDAQHHDRGACDEV